MLTTSCTSTTVLVSHGAYTTAWLSTASKCSVTTPFTGGTPETKATVTSVLSDRFINTSSVTLSPVELLGQVN